VRNPGKVAGKPFSTLTLSPRQELSERSFSMDVEAELILCASIKIEIQILKACRLKSEACVNGSGP